jgi:hypothetical protein
MSKVYIYVVDRDFGFAPNPFHGVCTLATCKPRIRNPAKVGDWVVGIGGGSLKAPGKCVFGMKVTQKLTFNQYWLSEDFADKKPVRNGSKTMMLGDNIYFQDDAGSWHQAHSHHSLPDGSLNEYNLSRDTLSKYVLISNHFYYFGSLAPLIPTDILAQLNYKNAINHRTYSIEDAQNLIDWLQNVIPNSINRVLSDPFNFNKSDVHYSVENNRLSI